MGKALKFSENYSIGEGNTINKSTSISSLLLNGPKHPGFNPYYTITA
jgi:hypothetical protein